MGQDRFAIPKLCCTSRPDRSSRRTGRLRLLLALLLTFAGVGNLSAATTDIETLYVSPDIHLVVGSVEVRDHQVLADDLAGSLTPMTLGALLPEDSAINALHRREDGSFLFSLDGWALLGGLPIKPADVVSWDGTYSIVFNATVAALPPGLNVDAVSLDGDDFLLSFDTHADLPGGPYADDDLVRWDGAAFSLAFDGAASGVPFSLDLDAAHRLDSGNLLLSFDSGGTVGGVTLADEDIIEHDPVAGTWELLYDGSAFFPEWVAADLEALAAGERPNVLEIPVLSPIGLVGLALILALSATVIFRRRMEHSPENDSLETS